MNTAHYFRKLKLIYGALAMGQLLFAGLIYFILATPGHPDKQQAQTFMLAVPLMCLGAVAIAYRVFNTRLKAIRLVPGLADRLIAYQSAVILKASILETAVLFALVAYLWSSYYLFLLIAGVMIAYFFLYFPAVSRISRELRLTYEEEQMLKSGEVV